MCIDGISEIIFFVNQIMRKFFPFLFLIFLFFLELILAPRLSFWAARPNFVLVGFLACFIFTSERRALKFYLPIFLLLDFYSPLPFGVLSLSFIAVLFFLWLLSLKFFREKSLGAFALAMILGSIIYIGSQILFLKFFTLIHLSNLNYDLFYGLLHLVLGSAVYNLILSLIFFRILKYAHTRLW
ncbi:hypothetical protein COT68_02185 [bacterium (Candidatus Torokbacteria) CG09_land_8_20_14_0_10_42_11]|nr:MAG: hypothetical protein COT68_02185 [bacterium (Candidatus Torokbacteria) CG09_land_8_20_14_0_10_42_11]